MRPLLPHKDVHSNLSALPPGGIWKSRAWSITRKYAHPLVSINLGAFGFRQEVSQILWNAHLHKVNPPPRGLPHLVDILVNHVVPGPRYQDRVLIGLANEVTVLVQQRPQLGSTLSA
jgi:hypothetical protein